MAVAIIHRGQEHVRCYGVADVRTGRPVTARTNFRIASNSKTFTGTAAMRLVDEGRLDLDLPVRRYVTDFRPPAGAEGVTVRQVLNHSAGWLGYDYHDTGSDDQALARYVRDVHRLPQLTPVGRTFSYSNAALSVAGRVVETVTGTPFEAAVHRLVLAPLGMTGSGYDTRRVADQATPHAVVDGRAVADPSLLFLPRSGNPFGGLLSSAADMLSYLRFHLGDGRAADGQRLMSRASLQGMWRRVGPGGTLIVELNGAGVSWMVRPTAQGPVVVHHGGDLPGFHSGLLLVPERDFALAMLTNSESGPLLVARFFYQDWALRRFAGVSNLPAPRHLLPPDELAVLGRLLAGTGGRAIVFGHHHYASLTEEARKALFGWIRAGDVMMYMSGHTHNGHWISHYGVEAGDKEAARATESVRWTELNLGSTVDWPIEYRALAVSAPAANRTTTINAPIYRLDETAACAGDVIEKDFEAYKKALVPGGATYSEYANRALFDVFRRLLGIAPTAVTPTNVGAIQWPCADCRADSAVLEAIRKMSASNDLDAQARMLVALARFDAERPLAAAPRADRDRLRRCYAFIASRQETNQGDPFSAPSDECTLDSQCGASRYCNTGVEGIGRNVCRPRIADGGACTKEHQCTSGRCSPWRPQDGQATGICYTPASRAGGQSCRIDLECRAGKCNSNKVCVCKDDGDCAGGFYCDQGLDLHQNACKRKLADGESCGVGIDIGRRCQSGKCILGKCK